MQRHDVPTVIQPPSQFLTSLKYREVILQEDAVIEEYLYRTVESQNGMFLNVLGFDKQSPDTHFLHL